MKSIHSIAALVFISTTVLGGCASNAPQQTTTYSSESHPDSRGYGEIDSIQVMSRNNNTSGAGAVVGGLVGGLLGHQIGGGSGNTAATIVGAVGGAVVGNKVEQNKDSQTADRYQIRVHLDNGDTTTVVQDSVYDLRVGNRVRIADGRVYRY